MRVVHKWKREATGEKVHQLKEGRAGGIPMRRQIPPEARKSADRSLGKRGFLGITGLNKDTYAGK